MKKYLVMGLGKSGISAAKLLAEEADVTCWDIKPEEEFNAELLEELKGLGIKLILGTENVEEHFDECIISPGIRTNHPAAQRADILSGELELAYENCRGTFAAITGTNGKTTVTTLVGLFANAAERECVVAGNIGTPVCDSVLEATENTLMITEVSSFQLETIKNFHPYVSAILNLAPDHLDRHGTAEEYYGAKCRIFENQTEEDYLVYNLDDEETVKHIQAAKCLKVPFTRKRTAIELPMENDLAYLSENMICVRLNGKDYEIISTDDIQVIGLHNVENILAACLIAGLLGIKPRFMTRVLKGFKGVEHRMEYVRELKGVKYINDSKGTNPNSSIRAIEAIETPIILIAGGYEKNSDFHELIGSFNGKVRYLILLGKTAERMAKTAIECGFKDENIIKCSTLEACVASAHRLGEKGDTVLLSPACASWDMFESFEQRGEEFKKLVKSLS